MSEFLAKYRSVAPWAGMILILIVDSVMISYSQGLQTQQILELNRRMTVLEMSDREQTRWLERLVAIETAIKHIGDDIKACKPYTQGSGYGTQK